MELARTKILIPTSATKAKTAIVLSITILFLYKLWKIFGSSFWELNPQNNYYLYQSIVSAYRVIAFVIGILILKRLISHQAFWKITTQRSLILITILYTLSHFLLYLAFNHVELLGIKATLFEFATNLLVGFWEEIYFRGIILTALLYFLKPRWAIILSSLLFTLWHYDVYPAYHYFLSCFAFSIFFSYCYHIGIPLGGLALIHFAIDMNHFGLKWISRFNNPQLFSFSIIVLQLFFLVVLMRFNEKENS